jgi:hypothetical protein
MSARRLGVKRIDLYYLHSGRAKDASFEDQIGTLLELCQQGLSHFARPALPRRQADRRGHAEPEAWSRRNSRKGLGNVNPIWPRCDCLKWPHPMARDIGVRHP